MQTFPRNIFIIYRSDIMRRPLGARDNAINIVFRYSGRSLGGCLIKVLYIFPNRVKSSYVMCQLIQNYNSLDIKILAASSFASSFLCNLFESPLLRIIPYSVIRKKKKTWCRLKLSSKKFVHNMNLEQRCHYNILHKFFFFLLCQRYENGKRSVKRRR